VWRDLKMTRAVFSPLRLLPFTLLVLAGCATVPEKITFGVVVDAISRPDAANKRSYVMLPGNKDTTAKDLQYLEYAKYVMTALAAARQIRGARPEDSDLIVFLSYGIGNPQTHQYTYVVPVWGQTGYSGATTQLNPSGFGCSATTTYTPTFGVTGYVPRTESVTTYFRFIVLDAYDAETYKRDKKLEQVWRTIVTSTGSSGDLRRVFPALVAGAASYFGTNPGGKVQVNVDEQSPAVMFLKNAPRPLPVAPARQPSPAPLNRPATSRCDSGMYWNSVTNQCTKIGQ
jgi:hypothetical protein